ncbi:substrate-binding domain-containing protein [Azotobacter vinelandii]|uniref:substrate-binding domain-containing protein n=1 Tax=Azotobacter vinelandii TaxID=354 RepID=UPI002666741A|nr:substrate-binding domain-containing protein [Azotobacter vinelandii]WKN22412.1 substrate-binding domain-containing protein [Azotobacter vinelandii]
MLAAPHAAAESRQFALLAKRIDQHFFIQAGRGCAEAAAAEGDICLLLGATGPAHFRRQNEALEEALGRDLDGIALSVTHSHWLAEHALQHLGRTPLITFDSDLAPAERHLRRGYVGIDNLAFGRRLGQFLQRFRPAGGRLCILSGSHQDPNLRERLAGIRQQLRGADGEHDADRLAGENGWFEVQRCPLYTADNQENALLQLATLLKAAPPDAIVSVGSWPVYEAEAFRRRLGPLLAELDTTGRRPAIVITVDEPDARQLALLEDGLIQAYLGVESTELGRQSYHMMKRLAEGRPIAGQVLVGVRSYLSGSASTEP